MTPQSDLISASLPITKGFEGTVPWMYLDTRGFVTCATGHLLEDVAAAQALPWYKFDFSRIATQNEVATEFARVKALKPGFKPASYRKPESPLLRGMDMDMMLELELGAFAASLAKLYPQFATWPQPAQLAALDMAYNLGVPKLSEDYPLFNAAAKDGDFLAMATECHRNGPSLERNSWTAAQFSEAYSIERQVRA